MFLAHIKACTLTCADYLWIHADRPGRLQTQKNPQSFHLAGFQDFSGQFWYRRERILGWRLCLLLYKFMFFNCFLFLYFYKGPKKGPKKDGFHAVKDSVPNKHTTNQ